MENNQSEKTSVNFERVRNIEEIMHREGYVDGRGRKKDKDKWGIKFFDDFAHDIGVWPANLTRSMNSGKVTESLCRKIVDRFPKYRLEGIMGYDEYLLKSDFEKVYIQRSAANDNAALTLLDSAYREVCAREGTEAAPLDNIPELLLLQAQLRDYAISLMWNYAKHREHSYFWGTFNQLLDSAEKNLKVTNSIDSDVAR